MGEKQIRVATGSPVSKASADLDACPRCGQDDARFTGRYGPMVDGAFVCFRCARVELSA